MDTPELSPIDDLRRKIQRTARIRYIAARRLGYHRLLSGWVVALASLTLIMIPLVQAVGGQSGYSPTALAALEVGLAIFILVYSIFLSAEDFSLRAYQMFQCGNQLSDLVRKLAVSRAASAQVSEHERFNDAYTRILSANENHRYVDYLNDQLQNPLQYFGGLSKGARRIGVLKVGASLMLRYFFGFLHYGMFLAFFVFTVTRILP